MNKSLIIGFILVFSLLACTSTTNVSTAKVGTKNATAVGQQRMDPTQEYLALQTIIALEQGSNPPTPEAILTLPELWTEITTTPISTPHSAFATALLPLTPILLAPSYNSYRMACYVEKGVQLMITGRNSDSSWFRVTFGQGQTCIISNENGKLTNIIPDPTLQLWIYYSTCAISGDLSDIAIIIPTPTPAYRVISPTPTPTTVPPTPTP